MQTFRRCLRDYLPLWRVWSPLLLLTALLPPVVLAMPLVEKRLIDSVILRRQLSLLPAIVLLYSGLWVAAAIAQTLGSLLSTLSGEIVSLRLRRRLFAHCEALSIAFSQRRHSGQTVALFLNDVPATAALFGGTLNAALGSLIAVLAGAIIMLSLSPRLALLTGVATPLVAGLAVLATRPLRPAARQVQEKAAELTERLHESLTGLREVVTFGREQSQELRFAATLGELLRLRLRLTAIDAGIQTGQSLFSLAVTLAIFGYGGYLAAEGQITLGTVIAMRLLFGQVFQPAGQLFGLITGAQKALGAADRVYAFLDQSPEVQSRPEAVMPREVAGAIRFENVSFAYREDRPVLHDVSFKARPGEVIALVGPSGAGKSTLASLIMRFHDPAAGRVWLDGSDLRDLPLAGLRGAIAVVFQDSFLFATTVYENIALGCEQVSADAIVAAAQAANAWEFIERLPDGLQTQVGERGVQLSEGQKQRLAIARALLRDPRILILDEPTSALDARSESLMQAALDNATYQRTTFVIAHRLATVQRADRILVLDGGRIVEQGTHAQLLARRGLYRELFDLQFARAELPAGVAV